jgi:hypothetical protein
VRLSIFDLSGRAVLAHRSWRPRGWNQLDWYGLAGAGHRVAAGLYWIEVQAASARRVTKIVRTLR